MVPVAAAPRSILQSGEGAWVRERGSESFFFPRFPSSVQNMPALNPHEMTTPLSIHPLPHLAQPNSLLPSYTAMPPQVPFNGLPALEYSTSTGTSVSYSKAYRYLAERFFFSFCLSHIHPFLYLDPILRDRILLPGNAGRTSPLAEPESVGKTFPPFPCLRGHEYLGYVPSSSLLRSCSINTRFLTTTGLGPKLGARSCHFKFYPITTVKSSVGPAFTQPAMVNAEGRTRRRPKRLFLTQACDSHSVKICTRI